jgi:enterobacterial common antigen flippase
VAVPSIVRRIGERAGWPVVSTLTATVLLQLLAAVSGVVLARILGPTGRGELAVVMLWPILLLTIGTVGVTDSITYHAARMLAPLRALVGTSLALGLAQGVAIVALGLVAVPLILAKYSSEVVRDCMLFLAVIPIQLIWLYMLSVLNGAHRFTAFNVLRVAPIALVTLELIGLAIAGELTITTAVAAYLVAHLIAVVAGVTVVLSRVEGVARPERWIARRVLAFGWRSQLSTISNLPNVRLDQLAISLVLTAHALGLYVVAWNVTLVTSLIGYSVVYAALPGIAAKPSQDEQRLAARRYVSGTLVISLAVAIPLLVFAPTILRLAFGEEFAAAAEVTRVLLVASVVLGTSRVLGAVLKAANRPLDATIAEGAAIAVTLIGLSTLLPVLGTTGAALTLLLAYTASALFALNRANRALGARRAELLLPKLGAGVRNLDSQPVVPPQKKSPV